MNYETDKFYKLKGRVAKEIHLKLDNRNAQFKNLNQGMSFKCRVSLNENIKKKKLKHILKEKAVTLHFH